MTLYVYRDVVPMSGWIATGLMLLWVVTWHTPLLNVTATLAFGYTAIYLATLPTAGHGRLAPQADISYGVYLYGFVAEQIAVAALGARANAATVLVIAVPLTAGCAMLSWKLVERPALRLKAHLRPRLESTQPGVLSNEAVRMVGAVAPEGLSIPVDATAP
jgi:peptidoglycan/LPS O-acetylase OafA/YrhL